MARHSIKFLAAIIAAMTILGAAVFLSSTRADETGPATQPATQPANPTSAGTRDPALWPFAAESPWNTPLGAAAHYDAIVSGKFETSGTFSVNCTHWSHPIFVATDSDPVKEIHENNVEKPSARTNIPAAAAPDPEEDGHLHIINPAHTRVMEMYHAKVTPDGITAEGVVENDIRGLGIYKKPHGMRAYGGSSIGGVIRRGELKSGIRHVLASATLRGVLSKTAPGGAGFTWPANHADEDWNRPVGEDGYGDKGNVFMGSLLAIPPDVDVKTLVGATGPAYEIARALQDYGCYIVDTSGDNLDITIEPAAAGEVPGDLEQQLAKLLPKLKVVSNNTADTPGGGGKPRRLPAPELIDPPAGYRPGMR